MAKKSTTSVHLKNSSRYPHLNWQLDADYVRRLSQAEREWLAQFTAEYYRSAPKNQILTVDELRVRWREYKANARDVMTRGDGSGRRVDNQAISWDIWTEERHDQGEDDLIDRIDARYGPAPFHDED